MYVPEEPAASNQASGETTPTRPDHVKITVKTLTVKVFLNRSADELLPLRYLRKAKQTVAAQSKAWIFRNGKEDGRDVNLVEWSEVDLRYRGVFNTLFRCPDFARDLFDGGSESCQDVLDGSSSAAQGRVVYALLDEVGKLGNLQRAKYNRKGIFYLAPRLICSRSEYWTGYREKNRDGPATAGFLALESRPELTTKFIIPVSTTMHEETLESALRDKYKLILSQLLHHVRILSLPGDRLPDQEIFLIGLHGSRLYLMRGFFPGQKLSSLWCRRELPTSITLPDTPAFWPSLFPDADSHSTANAKDTYTGATHGESVKPEQGTRSRSNSNNRFYTPVNLDRLEQVLQARKLEILDQEQELRTFRALATREYDLWLSRDFTAAVEVLLALHMYLLSGRAQCGFLQQAFICHPYNEDGNESDSPEESGDELDAILNERARKAQQKIDEREENLRRAQIIQEKKEANAMRMRESMFSSSDDRISSLSDARREWWDFVWEDSEESSAKGKSGGHGEADSKGDSHEHEDEDEDEDMIVGSLDM